MPVSVTDAALGHRLAALAGEDERGLGGHDAGDGGGGELAHTVPGDEVGGDARAPRDGRAPAADEQRLRDGGVADLVRVGGGAVADQVEAGDGRPPVRRSATPGSSSHGFEESGGLGALSGRDDGEHESNSAL